MHVPAIIHHLRRPLLLVIQMILSRKRWRRSSKGTGKEGALYVAHEEKMALLFLGPLAPMLVLVSEGVVQLARKEEQTDSTVFILPTGMALNSSSSRYHNCLSRLVVLTFLWPVVFRARLILRVTNDNNSTSSRVPAHVGNHNLTYRPLATPLLVHTPHPVQAHPLPSSVRHPLSLKRCLCRRRNVQYHHPSWMIISKLYQANVPNDV